MRAPTLVIALLLAQGCAPVTLGTTSSALVSTGGARADADCVARDFCGASGGSGSVTIPLLIILAVITVPAVVHHHILRGAPKGPAGAPRTGSASTE